MFSDPNSGVIIGSKRKEKSCELSFSVAFMVLKGLIKLVENRNQSRTIVVLRHSCSSSLFFPLSLHSWTLFGQTDVYIMETI